jgi:hypothetical protein
MSIAKTFEKYGKNIKVTIMTNSKDKSIIFDRPDNLSSAYLNRKYAKIKR